MAKTGCSPFVFSGLLLLSACGTPPNATGVHDPYEAQNRAMFETNLTIDRAIGGGPPDDESEPFRLPDFFLNTVENVAGNLETPSRVMNAILQGKIEDAGHNAFRFVLNSTLGLGGIFDPATDFGLEERYADFGQTLYVWGVPEGAYWVLPILGPSTERHALGMAVDALTDPFGLFLEGRDEAWVRAAVLFETALDRVEHAETLNTVVYGSEDGYAQSRLVYLESRRFEVKGRGPGSDNEYDYLLEVPYEE